ncbi:MAG: phosphoribosylglycinamide formyltransferase [Treponema sp.]|nr:phosphoribosylglycinamide formyltransferase [Treponema sp.]
MKIAVLVSGGGTNLQALIDETQKNKNALFKISVVISSTKDAYALERAKKANIPAIVASPFNILGSEKVKLATREEKNEAVSNKVLDLCKEYKVDAIVLAGFLTVLQGKIITEYSNRIINLHPALLPKFGGVGMWGHHVHEAVIAAGEKESGCTIHLVDDGCDTGEILIQKKVPVLPNDTAQTLYERIAPYEHIAMVEGVNALAKRFAFFNLS